MTQPVRETAGTLEADGVIYQTLGTQHYRAWVRRETMEDRRKWAVTLFRKHPAAVLGVRIKTRSFQHEDKAWDRAREGLVRLEAELAETARQAQLIARG